MTSLIRRQGWILGVRTASTALAFAVVLIGMVATQSAQGQTYTVLHSFAGKRKDGASPGGVVLDAAGNVYGTTNSGGTSNFGTVFKVDTGGNETVLYNFCSQPNCNDGRYPAAGLVWDAAGNLYGTTAAGGGSDGGTVFKLDATNTEAVLWSFHAGTRPDGYSPYAGVVWDAAGNLYGTTFLGGVYDNGTVYKLEPSGKETVLHSFTGGLDGDGPDAGVITNGDSLYGTVSSGGFGYRGTVFSLDKTGTGIALYQFRSPTDGEYPEAALIQDAAGRLYSTTYGGGAYNLGTVFRLDRNGSVTVLHSFSGGARDGAKPAAGLVRDAAGNLYGTTFYGGSGPCVLYGSGCGTVFKLDTSGILTVLYSFTGGADGAFPSASLVLDTAGNLYGTTAEGGSGPCNSFGQNGCGVVFKLTP